MRGALLRLGLVCGLCALGTAPLQGQASMDEAYGLLSEGRTSEGRTALMEATATLAPSAAVPHLKAARLLGRLTTPLQPRAARAIAASYRGAPDGFTTLRGLVDEAGPDDAPPLLAYVALMADQADPDEAERLRVRLIQGYPEALEWSDAVIEVAAHRLDRGRDTEEARAWLETLITNEPEGALAPSARRILAQLNEAGA